MSPAPVNETPAQRRARLDKKNEVQRLYRLNRKKAAPPITVGATRAGSEPAAAPAKPKPQYTKAQRKSMLARAALARAALAKYRAEGKVFATKRKATPKRPERAAAALMHDAGANLPVPFERVPRVRGEILDSGERLAEHVPTNGHAVDMDLVADLVLAIARKLSR